MHEAAYEAESVLQHLLAEYPGLLAGDSDSIGHRWLLVQREAALPGEEDGAGRWSVDHLFLDAEAVPTIVEVKRSSDTRLRREVVGQMLDYAANATAYWRADRLRGVLESRCEENGADPDAALEEALLVSDAEEFWPRVNTNLAAGRLRLVFVADVIPSELRRIVEYLNQEMSSTEVLALEVSNTWSEKGSAGRSCLGRSGRQSRQSRASHSARRRAAPGTRIRSCRTSSDAGIDT